MHRSYHLPIADPGSSPRPRLSFRSKTHKRKQRKSRNCKSPLRFHRISLGSMAMSLGGPASTHGAKHEAGGGIPTKSRIKKQTTPHDFPAQTTSPPLESRRQSFPLRNHSAGTAKGTTEAATKSRIGNPSKQRTSNIAGTTTERVRRLLKVELGGKDKLSEIATKSHKSSIQRQLASCIAQNGSNRC